MRVQQTHQATWTRWVAWNWSMGQGCSMWLVHRLDWACNLVLCAGSGLAWAPQAVHTRLALDAMCGARARLGSACCVRPCCNKQSSMHVGQCILDGIRNVWLHLKPGVSKIWPAKHYHLGWGAACRSQTSTTCYTQQTPDRPHVLHRACSPWGWHMHGM